MRRAGCSLGLAWGVRTLTRGVGTSTSSSIVHVLYQMSAETWVDLRVQFVAAPFHPPVPGGGGVVQGVKEAPERRREEGFCFFNCIINL